MNYYISDLHLFQETSIRFDERPFKNLEEMHEIIKEKWNCRVNNGDKVFILGDISCRGKNENLISYISTLKGQKILIKGNHDDVSDYRSSAICRHVYKTEVKAINVGCIKPWMKYEPRSLEEILQWRK